MKKSFTFLTVSICAVFLFFVNASFAQNAASACCAENIKAINALVSGYGQDWITPASKQSPYSLLYPSYSSGYNDYSTSLYDFYMTILQDNLGIGAQNPAYDPNKHKEVPKTLTSLAVYNVLTSGESAINTRIDNLYKETQFLPLDMSNINYVELPGTSAIVPRPAPIFTAPLDLNTLLLPMQYSIKPSKTVHSSQKTDAMNFITLVSGQANPLPVIDFSQFAKPEDITNALSQPTVKAYLLALRSYAAEVSVGTSNLYQLYQERLPTIPTEQARQRISLPQGSTLPAWMQEPTISPLALDAYTARRRINDKNWYVTMESATPVTLQREMVYLLAEIRYELFQQRMLQERILATVSVNELQNSGQAAFNLNNMMRSICANEPFNKASGVCPAGVTTATSD